MGILTADEQDINGQWSTSKWIRDELAYALGDEQRVVVRMIEDGCDTEGRIFGDREYIPFVRTDLTQAIIKLAWVLQKYLNS